jgi:hypothetical protein
MNKLIAGLLITFSSALMACPNLEGTFLCETGQPGKTQRITIEQEGKIYTQRTEQGEFEISADGIGRNFELDISSEVRLSGVISAACSANQLLIDIVGTGTYQGEKFAFTEKSETFLDAQGNLAQHTKGATNGTAFESNSICIRE